MTQTPQFDVLIAGGGPVGACAGALLAAASPTSPTQLRVGILEPSRAVAPVAGAPLDLRVSAFSRASERILSAAGAWGRLDAGRMSPYERMRVWHESSAPRGPDALVFDAADLGEPNLGYIVENRPVQAALLESFEQAGGRLIAAELAGLAVQDECVQVTTAEGVLTTRLVVGADGARSRVREAVGITAEAESYAQQAIVAAVTTERPHERCAWQRFLAQGTLAFLPLADGSSSIVWSLDEDTAIARMNASPQEFEAQLHLDSDGVLGALQLVSERLALPLQRLAAHRYSAHRLALLGDAAHVVHPLAGQGVNLGLLDAAALAELVLAAHGEGEDPGAQHVLRRYERWRKSDTYLMSTAIDLFNRFLAHGSGPLARVAQRGLSWVNRSDELKRFFMARALGTRGELPRAALESPRR
jgi:2-octaprenylphenol hydroxylase